MDQLGGLWEGQPGRYRLSEKEPDQLAAGGHDLFADYNGQAADLLQPEGAGDGVVVGDGQVGEAGLPGPPVDRLEAADRVRRIPGMQV